MLALVKFKCDNEDIKSKIITDLEKIYGKRINTCNYDGVNYISLSSHDNNIVEKFKKVKEKYSGKKEVKEFFVGTTKEWY